MKVVYNAEPLDFSEKAKKLWEERGYTYISGGWDQLRPGDVVPTAEVLIVRLSRFIGKDELQHFPNLKMLVSATTGHDHIDLNELRNRSIKLVSLRGHDEFLKTIPSTAEHTWALLMALIRKIPAAHADVINGNWRRDFFKGQQLAGKTLGIVGFGRTGARVASYAHVFGMTVLAYDPYNKDVPINQRVYNLTELVAASDIISVHVHLNSETQGMIDEKVIKVMKSGAYLVNTSRGRVVDEDALVMALSSGHLAGIATDVLSSELGAVQQSKLLAASKSGLNVIITPHIGGATWEAMWECEEFIAQKATE